MAATYALPDGMPVFRSVTSWRYGKEGFLKEVREQVGSERPAFVNGFVHCWTCGPDELALIYEQRDADMVFVTPSQLAALYRQPAKKAGQSNRRALASSVVRGLKNANRAMRTTPRSKSCGTSVCCRSESWCW